jgi:6,7-dimethyl-8-ribityllumazine synthase
MATSRITTVPGALELPLTLQAMAQSGRFDALVALGAVIRGETYHFEIVSNESARGITDVQLNTGIPIANAVLTTENDDQALVRMVQKGAEAAQAAIEMANLLKAVKLTGQMSSKSPRRRAREFVIQGLYQWQVGDQDEAAIQVQAEGVAGFDKADNELYVTLLARRDKTQKR